MFPWRITAPKPRTLNYQQVLALVEAFVVETGLRDFCSNTCHGKCCQGCYNSPNACHQNEGRRLPCSIYFCSRVSECIGKDNPAGGVWLSAWYDLRFKALQQLDAMLRPANPYFAVNKSKLVRKFRLPETLVLAATSDAGKQLVKERLPRLLV